MKLSKKDAAEVANVYDTWMHSYLNGDVKTYDSYFDDEYRFIGSTDNEDFLNRTDTTKFFEATADQLAGKVEIRNSRRTFEKFDGLIFLTELFDAYFLMDTEWAYYGKFRFTSALQKKKEGWRFIYQHFSTPDSKAQEGDTIGTEQIAAENQMLREAIKRRTIELVQKNRELQIETALERVRSRAIKMDKSDELIEVVHFLNEEIKRLGILIDNSSIITDFGNFKKGLINWIAAKNYNYMEKFHIPYIKHQVTTKFENAIKKNISYYSDSYSKPEKDEYFKLLFKYSDFKKIPKERQQFLFNTPVWIRASVLSKNSVLIFQRYYNSEFTKEEEQIFKQFGKVFEQAYTRFLDLQKAEAHAREAEIQLALERVRAGAMAMHKSEELSDTASILFQELNKLGLNILRTGVCIFDFNNDSAELWLATEDGDKTETKVLGKVYGYMHPMYRKWIDAGAQKKKLFQHKISGKEVPQYYDVATSVLNLPKQTTYNKSEIYNGFFFPEGSINIISLTPLTEEECEIGDRFANVFGLLYRRFLDLQKAEAQAREAQIEVALERVRAKAMAMHTSNDLKEVARELRRQMGNLGLKELETCAIHLYEGSDEFFTSWAALQSPNSKSEIILIEAQLPKKGVRNLEKIIDCYNQKKLDYVIANDWNQFQEFSQALKVHSPEALKVVQKTTRNRQKNEIQSYWSVSDFKGGSLLLSSVTKPEDAYLELLRRFTNVFDLAYRRFSDLKKAEAQAREAEIQLALERIRARTMAMQKSEELAETATLLFQLAKQLGIETYSSGFNIWNEENNELVSWMSNPGGILNPPFIMPLTEHNQHARFFEAWKDKAQFIEDDITGDQLIEHYRYLRSFPLLKKAFTTSEKMGIKTPDRQVHNVVFFSYGYLLFITLEPRPQHHEIFKRFGKVFEQTYTRFLDLQKAEAQVRESEIQLALERVRARTMAMYKSSELNEVAAVLFEQIRNLGGKLWGTGFALCNIEAGQDEFWFANELGVMPPVTIPNTEDKVHRAMYQAWKEKKDYLLCENGGEELAQHYRYLNSLPQIKAFFEPVLEAGQEFPTWQQWHAAYFSKGYLLIITVERYPEPDILKRFAKVFEQTYTRFLDLQKAEAQAREAQIEAALERVRSRTMGMQHSNELQEAAVLLFQQVIALGVPAFGSGFNIWDDDRKYATAWMAGQNRMQPPFKTSSSEDIFLRIYEAAQNGESLFVEEQGGEALKAHYKYMNSIPVFKEIADKMAVVGQTFPTSQIMHCAFFSHGYLMFISFEPVPDAYDIFIRFAKVFEQTYTRFLDLQKAEKQAREVMKQASLDRVRGEIASMRNSEDLNRITPVIWNELQALDVPFIRCGVFIIDEETENVQVYLTTPEGKALGVLNLDFEANHLTINTIEHWRNNEVHKVHWNKDEFTNWVRSMMETGQVQSIESYQGSANAPDALNLHFVPFKQGMLYVGNTSPLSEEKIDLVGTLAKAFSIAYARYEDFRHLEDAKNKIELTLSELKAAQKQLIQSEKMASLGELTAGIAHEIQNPLNFVNNFSEVSIELLEELFEEIEHNNLNEIRAITTDVVQNLEKINHHGKRAESIVKGMLMHSRGSSGKKELTDINSLADEYLRLSYHGFRAKDKSFNADFKLVTDENLPKIEVVPQDIGRVLLNLINNAFYAVNKKAKSEIENYKPLVIVSTTKYNKTLQISVKDNGDGIPESIKDKIFQPFFTTKPTGSGTGLGLSLSYDIVKAHGGSLIVKSVDKMLKLKEQSDQLGQMDELGQTAKNESLGHGTEFIVTLPLEKINH